jgi:hypothetical protein
MFDEMITIEQSMKHLVQYYQLRQSYLGIKSVTKLPSQISAPVTSVTIPRSAPVTPSPIPRSVPVTVPVTVPVSQVTQGDIRDRSNTMYSNAAALTARPASVVSSRSAAPTISSQFGSPPSISIAPN